MNGCHLEVTATEPDTDEVIYLPMRFEFDAKTLAQYLRPHETTVIDIELLRLPSDKVFSLTRY